MLRQDFNAGIHIMKSFKLLWKSGMYYSSCKNITFYGMDQRLIGKLGMSVLKL